MSPLYTSAQNDDRRQMRDANSAPRGPRDSPLMLAAARNRAKRWSLTGSLVTLMVVTTGCGTAARPSASTAAATALPSPQNPEQIRIEGEAMLPLLGNGDFAVADRAAYAASSPQRGDLVLMESPENSNRLFVKRVVGVPGDVIEIDGRHVDPAQPNAAPRTAVEIQPGGVGSWETLVEPYLPDQRVDPWDEMNNRFPWSSPDRSAGGWRSPCQA